MKMQDNRFVVSEATMGHMEQLVYSMQDACFLTQLVCTMLLQLDATGLVQFQELILPYTRDSLGRILDLGLEQVKDCCFAYANLVCAVRDGVEYNYIGPEIVGE